MLMLIRVRMDCVLIPITIPNPLISLLNLFSTCCDPGSASCHITAILYRLSALCFPRRDTPPLSSLRVTEKVIKSSWPGFPSGGV